MTHSHRFCLFTIKRLHESHCLRFSRKTAVITLVGHLFSLLNNDYIAFGTFDESVCLGERINIKANNAPAKATIPDQRKAC